MKPAAVEILTIGNELLRGFTLDTNAQWLGMELNKAGFEVIHKTTVGDHQDHLLAAFSAAEQRADVVLMTGGLGPTSDDLTKPCLAAFFNCGMKLHEEALVDIAKGLKRKPQELNELQRQQAILPEMCEKITNTLGTAPGMWFEKNQRVFVSMPGVPAEMKHMTTEEVIPRLKSIFATLSLCHHIIRTVGIGESSLVGKISSWEHNLPKNIKLAYLPNTEGVKIVLASSDNSKAELVAWGEQLIPLVGDYIYGYGNDPLELILGKMLYDKNLTLALAESCTGGYLSHRITAVSGSSRYYLGSVIAYANAVKINLLGVSAATLAKNGAVSEAVVSEMAVAVRQLLNADIGIAISGVAGPDGATPDRPVGTIWMALSEGEKIVTKVLNLSRNRLTNIRLASSAALNMVRTHVISNSD